VRLYELYLRFMVWLGASPPLGYEQLLSSRKNNDWELERKNNRRVGTRISRLTLGLILGVMAGVLFGAIFGGIFLGGAGVFFEVKNGADFHAVFDMFSFSGLVGVWFGLWLGIVGGLAGTIVSITVSKSVIEDAITGGGIGGAIVAIVGVGFYILAGVVD
jgi:hypothetical protein